MVVSAPNSLGAPPRAAWTCPVCRAGMAPHADRCDHGRPAEPTKDSEHVSVCGYCGKSGRLWQDIRHAPECTPINR